MGGQGGPLVQILDHSGLLLIICLILNYMFQISVKKQPNKSMFCAGLVIG